MRDDLNYLLADCAAAARVEPSTARNWLQRGHYWTGSPRPANGHPRLFSERDAARLALMGELLGLGLEPAEAGPVARRATEGGTAIPPRLGPPTSSSGRRTARRSSGTPES